MIRRLIGYAAAAAVTGYLYFMYDETVISGILVFILLYFPVSMLYLFCVRTKVTADLERVPAIGEQGKRIRAGVTLKNRLRFMGLRCEICVSVRGAYDKKSSRRHFTSVVPAQGEETLWCVFEARECGNTEVELERVRIYDFLGILCVERRDGRSASVRVMPVFSLMPVEITRRTREFQSEAEEYSQDKKGDAPSEL